MQRQEPDHAQTSSQNYLSLRKRPMSPVTGSSLFKSFSTSRQVLCITKQPVCMVKPINSSLSSWHPRKPHVPTPKPITNPNHSPFDIRHSTLP